MGPRAWELRNPSAKVLEIRDVDLEHRRDDRIGRGPELCAAWKVSHQRIGPFDQGGQLPQTQFYLVRVLVEMRQGLHDRGSHSRDLATEPLECLCVLL